MVISGSLSRLPVSASVKKNMIVAPEEHHGGLPHPELLRELPENRLVCRLPQERAWACDSRVCRFWLQLLLVEVAVARG